MSHVIPDFDAPKFDTLARAGVWVVDFSATWCPPCRVMDPIMESLVPEFAGRAQLGRIVSDEQPDLAARFGVQAFPTFMVFRDGQPIARRLGATSRAKMREWIEGALAA